MTIPSMFKTSTWDFKELTHQSKRVGREVPGVVVVLRVVPSGGLGLHIGITSCTFSPWTPMSKKNGENHYVLRMALFLSFQVLSVQKDRSRFQSNYNGRLHGSGFRVDNSL